MQQLPADRTQGTECRAYNLQADRADRAAVGRGLQEGRASCAQGGCECV